MKENIRLSELIIKATDADLKGSDMESIINIAKAGKNPRIKSEKHHFRTAAAIAAVFCILTASVSAALKLTGFDTVFDVPVDRGSVVVLESSSTNSDVEWDITDVWFDEYNLHIGGSVTTPEPLDTDGRYIALCYYRQPHEEKNGIMAAYIYPTEGENTAPFYMQSYHARGDDGGFERIGYSGDRVTLELKFMYLHDTSEMPENTEIQIKDYTVIDGEWTYTAELKSADNTAVSLKKRYEAASLEGGILRVDEIFINPFTMKLTGENFTYTYKAAVKNEYGEYSDVTERQGFYSVWLRFDDGRLLGKESGLYADNTNRVEFSEESENGLLFCFDKPIDTDSIKSVMIVRNYIHTEKDAVSGLVSDGTWTVHELPDDSKMIEAWQVMLEIPID